jgi:hypothetical protein
MDRRRESQASRNLLLQDLGGGWYADYPRGPNALPRPAPVVARVPVERTPSDIKGWFYSGNVGTPPSDVVRPITSVNNMS